MEKYNVLDIANYMINSKKILSNKKLQKLIYYAYSWYLVKSNNNSRNLNNKLFDSRIEAWVHGPVCPDLYFAYNNNNIKNHTCTKIDEKTKKILDLVLEIYGNYSGDELEYLTHQESPWINAREGYSRFQRCTEKIKDKDIFLFYSHKIK
jgi:uncharacterized phage-associated protein